MATKLRDPIGKYKFVVSISLPGFTMMRGGFSRVSGLGTEYDVAEYREGGDNNRVRKNKGLQRFDRVTLERGVMEDADLWELFISTERFSMTITEMDAEGNPIKAWAFENCFGQRYEEDELNATNSTEVLLQRLVIEHEGFEPIPV